MDTTESRHFAARLAELLRNERLAMADFLVALAEFDRKRGWVELGYPNLFEFLVRDLRMSKGTAFYRKVAVALIQSYPEIVGPIREGLLCITAVHALSKAITPANRAEVLPRFFSASKREARALAAELAPEAVVPRRVVVTPAPPVARPLVAVALPLATAAASVPCSQPVGNSCAANSEALRPETPRVTVEPLTAKDSRLHLTVSRDFLRKLEAARLAVSHAMPGATAEDVLSAGLDLLLAKDAKRKAIVKSPRPAPAPTVADVPAPLPALELAAPDYVPAHVRREVWERDRGRCQWPLDGGGICGSELRTELDHIVPRCRGGRPAPSNLRVLCRVHNQLAARALLGDELMDGYARNPRQPSLFGEARPGP